MILEDAQPILIEEYWKLADSPLDTFTDVNPKNGGFA